MNVTTTIDFWPPNENEGSQNCDPTETATPRTPTVIDEGLGQYKKQPSATPESEEGNRIRLQIAWCI